MMRTLEVFCVALLLAACNRADKSRGVVGRSGGSGPFYASEHDLMVPSASAVGKAGAPGLMRTAYVNRRATAELRGIGSSKLTGEAKFEESATGVLIHVEVHHCPPGSKSIHVHEEGNCEDLGSEPVDRHFNPDGAQHGLPSSNPHHAGDLGNIPIGARGDGVLDILTDRAGLAPGDAKSFLGHVLVIHESDDKGVGANAGGGKPIACGPIQTR